MSGLNRAGHGLYLGWRQAMLRDSVADTLPPGPECHSTLVGGAACSVSHLTQSTEFFLLIKHHLAPLVRAQLCLLTNLTPASSLPGSQDPHVLFAFLLKCCWSMMLVQSIWSSIVLGRSMHFHSLKHATSSSARCPCPYRELEIDPL